MRSAMQVKPCRMPGTRRVRSKCPLEVALGPTITTAMGAGGWSWGDVDQGICMGLPGKKDSGDFPEPDSTRERVRGSGVDMQFPWRVDASTVAPVPRGTPFGDSLLTPPLQFQGTKGARELGRCLTWSPGV